MDLNEAVRRLEAAKGDPNALALTTVDIVLASHPPGVAEALEAAAVPHWFDERLLRALLDSDTPDVPDWFDQIVRLTVVERFRAHDAWNVHEVTRLALRKRLATDHAARFRTLSARAASLVDGDETARSIESVYHHLSSEPDEGANELRRLWKHWSDFESLQSLQTLGKALDELYGQQLLTPRARGYALVVLGSIREDRIELGVWKAMAQEAVELMTLVGDEIGQFDAYWFLGKTLRAHGQLADALAAYDRAREALDRHFSSNPDYAATASERADLHLGIGRTLRERGQAPDALREFEAALEIRLRLHEMAPDDEQRRHELSVAYTDVGDALGQSRSSEAESYYLKALQLIEMTPGRRMRLESRLVSTGRLQSRLGDFFVRRGDGDGGLKRYEIGRQIFLRLVGENPEHFAWKNDVAVAHIDTGRVHLSRRQLAETEKHYATARAIYSDLTERDPANPSWKESLGLLCSSFGVLRESQEAFTDALSEYVEGERLLREVSEGNPDHAELKLALASAQNNLAVFVGRIADAVDDEEQKGQLLSTAVMKHMDARKILDELIQRDPGNVTWRGSLVSSERLIAAAVVRVAKARNAGLKVDLPMSPTEMFEVALNSYVSSASIIVQLSEEDPENVSYKYDHSVATARAGGVLELLGRSGEALVKYREALDEVEKLNVLDATNVDWADDVTYLKAAVSRLEDEQNVRTHS